VVTGELPLEYRPTPVAGRRGVVFMGTLAMVVTSVFLLTVLLDYPFAGQVAVGNAPLKQDNLARFWTDESFYRPKPGDEQELLTAKRLQGVYNSYAYGTLVLRCYDARHAVRACRPRDRRMRDVYRYHGVWRTRGRSSRTRAPRCAEPSVIRRDRRPRADRR
jgi:hypothetical protein